MEKRIDVYTNEEKLLSQWKRSNVIHVQQVDWPVPTENSAILNIQY